jgi:sec-independent protein translocase protein TatA
MVVASSSMTGFESPWHLAILAIVVLLVFGSKRLPEIGRSMGTGMREFKRSISSVHDDESTTPALPAGTTETTPAAGNGAARRDRDTIL